MSSLVYMRSKDGGTVYVYVNEKTDDGRYRRRCLGHLDPITGNVVSNRRRGEHPVLSARSYGVNHLLRGISDRIGLTRAMQVTFIDSWDSLMAFAFYSLSESKHYSDLERWMEFNDTPRMWPLTMDQTRSIMKGVTEERIDSFFKVWNKMAGDKEFVVTSISTDEFMEKRSKYDFEKFFSTEIQLCYGSESKLPISYRLHPTRYRTAFEMESAAGWMEWLERRVPLYVIEKEQASEMGIESMASIDHPFVAELSNAELPFRRFLEEFRLKETVYTPQIMTRTIRVSDRDIIAHVYYDPTEAEQAISRFLNIIDRCRFELEHQHYVANHSPLYNKYFLMKDRGNVELNSEAIMRQNAVAGYRMLITNTISDPHEAFGWLFKNDRFKEFYKNVHNEEDISSMYLYVESGIRSRMFIQFLSAILGAAIQKGIAETGLDETVDSILFQMKHMISVNQENRKRPVMSEMTNGQRRILAALLPNDAG